MYRILDEILWKRSLTVGTPRSPQAMALKLATDLPLHRSTKRCCWVIRYPDAKSVTFTIPNTHVDGSSTPATPRARSVLTMYTQYGAAARRVLFVKIMKCFYQEAVFPD